MASEEDKDKVGEILFEMMSTAMTERGLRMDYTSWTKIDNQVKENYMGVVERIVEVIEPAPLYVSEKDKELALDNLN